MHCAFVTIYILTNGCFRIHFPDNGPHSSALCHHIVAHIVPYLTHFHCDPNESSRPPNKSQPCKHSHADLALGGKKNKQRCALAGASIVYIVHSHCSIIVYVINTQKLIKLSSILLEKVLLYYSLYIQIPYIVSEKDVNRKGSHLLLSG